MPKIDPSMFPWNRLGMSRNDWWELAHAFYGLAHGDRKPFDSLPGHLMERPIGRICARYLETGDHRYIEEAGYALTFTRHWYVYLGRSM